MITPIKILVVAAAWFGPTCSCRPTHMGARNGECAVVRCNDAGLAQAVTVVGTTGVAPPKGQR